MSVGTIQAALLRIESATIHSQIAIFRIPGVVDKFEVQFASCYWTVVRIRAKDPLLIGVFNKHMLADLKKDVLMGAYG